MQLVTVHGRWLSCGRPSDNSMCADRKTEQSVACLLKVRCITPDIFKVEYYSHGYFFKNYDIFQNDDIIQ